MVPEIKKILLAIDLSDHSKKTLRYAISQAQKYQASVYVIHVVEPLTSLAKSFLELYLGDKYSDYEKKEKEIILNKVKDEIKELCNKELALSSSNNELIKHIEIREGLPYEEILNYSKEIEADLIIIGHGSKAYKGQILGSIARKLVNLSPIPLLIVK